MTDQLRVIEPLGTTDKLRTVNIRLFAVVAMIFIFVSSGAFGIEDMVSWSGPGLTILMLLALPVFWAMPMAMVCSELGSALPEEGGYYDTLAHVYFGKGEYENAVKYQSKAAQLGIASPVRTYAASSAACSLLKW